MALTDADTASTDSFEVDLSEGANVIKVKVTAAEGAALKTYTVTVTRAAASTDATLGALALSPGTLNPTFASADTSYTASVGYPVSRVTLSATASDAGATIAYLDGSDDALTDADTASTDSFEVDLSEGANAIKVKVTAADATTVKTYTVTVTRAAASTDAALGALVVEPGHAQSDVRVGGHELHRLGGVPGDARHGERRRRVQASATIAYLDGSDDALTDADTASTDSFEVDLSVGANVIKVKVTAEDATTVKTYTVTVTRAAASTDATLGALSLSPGTLNPAFASADTSYTASVGYPVTRVTVSADEEPRERHHCTYLDGSDDALTDADTASTDSFEVDLSEGANVIKVKVTAEDATTVKTYTVTVTRAAASTDATLGALSLSPGTLSPAFASADTSYTASVGYPVSRVTLSATASDAGATIAYLDGSDDALTDADTASTDSFEVDLSEGANVIKVKVTAEDATTTEDLHGDRDPRGGIDRRDPECARAEPGHAQPGVRVGRHELHRLGGVRGVARHAERDGVRCRRDHCLPGWERRRAHRCGHRQHGQLRGRPVGGGQRHQGEGYRRGRHHDEDLHGDRDPRAAIDRRGPGCARR